MGLTRWYLGGLGSSLWGRWLSGAGALRALPGSAERRSHHEWPGHRLEDALPAQRQLSERALALALSKLLF